MIDPPAKSTIEFSSFPVGAAPLESILRTEELRSRPWRPTDHEVENSALVALVSALAESPHTILQTLADKVLEVLHADSAGLSLLTKDETRFYWAAISGAWGPHIGGGTPRDFGPCGDVLDRNIPMLFTHWERRYPYLSAALPLADEGLLVPFYVNGKSVGTIWAIAHNSRRQFDAEDLRLLESMGRFASAAYQTVDSIENLKLEIAAREKAEAAVRQMASGLQAKIRRLVDSNIIGIMIWASDGAIIDANDTFLRIVGYARHDLATDGLNWKKLTPTEWLAADKQRVPELEATGNVQPYEKEYLHKNGHRVPVLIGGAMFEEPAGQGAAFVLDLTERKQAEKAARESERRNSEMQAELAHANRVATVGQLSVSIVHEISQPMAAAATNARAALRWLKQQQPNVEEALLTLDEITNNTERASEIIGRIRALVTRAPQRKESFEINEAIREVIMLGQAEVQKNGISVAMALGEGLPLVEGDRVQLQQVMLNLINNAVQAMSAVGVASRELVISTSKTEPNGVGVAVRDSGPGLDPANLERAFEAFHTTKPGGLGVGLSICRSIVEAHGGRLWATANTPRGATFQFTLPVQGSGVAEAPHAAVRTLVGNAIDGDTTAVRECFDRMDGKVTQGVDATDQVRGDITFTWTPPAD
jgi:PAS domain S-box-containing protein